MFSIIGYQTQEVPINGQSQIDVALQFQAVTGGELVVTSYNTQRQADITSAVATVDIESVLRQTNTSVLQRLDGRVAGVTVEASGSPGSRSTVRKAARPT